MESVVVLAGAKSERAATRWRLDPGVYRRRRFLVAGILLLLIAVALATAQAALAGTGGGPPAATGAAASWAPAGATVWVVRPGDTLWGIARSVDPGKDPRALVDRLAEETHGAALYPGEQIAVPNP
ncbi:MAG: LysM peptidoglycan-binding domain-containing protein [Acidimicrobiales bacterium]|nr:LysM peptidoglycan-binding domain-containing protein [Acidimicrobiales bacterium]